MDRLRSVAPSSRIGTASDATSLDPEYLLNSARHRVRRRQFVRAGIGSLTVMLLAVAVFLTATGLGTSSRPRTQAAFVTLKSDGVKVTSSSFASTDGNPRGGQAEQEFSISFTAGPGIPSDPGTGSLYELTPPTTPAELATTLASTFQVTGQQTSYQGGADSGGVQIGPVTGPGVRAFYRGGVLTWVYLSAMDGNAPGPGGPNPDLKTAESTAQSYLSEFSGDLVAGTPTATAVHRELYLDYPQQVGSVPTQLSSNFAFGPGNFLQSAGGFDAAIGPAKVITTISARRSIDTLQQAKFCFPELDTSGNQGDQTHPTPTYSAGLESALLSTDTFETASGSAIVVPVWILEGTLTSSDGTVNDPITIESIASRSSDIALQAAACIGI